MEVLNKDKWLSINQREDVEALRNYILNNFKDLSFKENTHQYFLNGKELQSVTKLIHRFQIPFNQKEKAQETFERNFDNPESKYYQKTVKEILTEWKKINKESTDKGHKNHNMGENCFYLLTEQYDKIDRELVDGNLIPLDQEEENVIRFFNDLPLNYIPLLAEARVYEEEKEYSGTFDLLMVYDNGKKLSQNLILGDFKTNKDLFKNFQEQKLLYPFENLLDSPYSTYIIQLSAYQIPLSNIGLKVIDRRLIYLRGENYSMYRLPDVTQKLINVL